MKTRNKTISVQHKLPLSHVSFEHEGESFQMYIEHDGSIMMSYADGDGVFARMLTPTQFFQFVQKNLLQHLNLIKH